MDAIQEAVQRLENVPLQNWKGKKDVEDAITQMSSIIRLFELPAASTATFNRLTQILRTKLLPLLRASLALALDLAAALFLFLQSNPKIPTLASGNLRSSCETLLVAVVSGILDFVEENSNVKIHEAVASSLYPILCPTYILTPFQPSHVFHGKVTPLVYQTLTATAESCPKNASRLRAHDLNCRNLGYTISVTREFLALEALLDLFGILIPSSKASRGARGNFIKSVFIPEFFGDISKQIVQHLEVIATPDWSVTSEIILRLLAKSNIQFPQPFEGAGFALNAQSIDGCSLFYLDKSELIANVDKEGKLDTLHVYLSTVMGITTSPAVSDEVNITVKLSQPPVLGESEMPAYSRQNITLNFTIKETYLAHFRGVLQQRNKTSHQLSTRKLSKGQPITLDSSAPQNVEDMILTQQERLQEVSETILTSPQQSHFNVRSNSKRSSLSPVIRGNESGFSLKLLVPTPTKPRTRSTSKATLPSTVFVGPNGDLSLDNPELDNRGTEVKDKKLDSRPFFNGQKTDDATTNVDPSSSSKSKLRQRNIIKKKIENTPLKPVAHSPVLSPITKEENMDSPKSRSRLIVHRSSPTRSNKITINADTKPVGIDIIAGNVSEKRKVIGKKRNRSIMSEDSDFTESWAGAEKVKKRPRTIVSDDSDIEEIIAIKLPDEPLSKRLRSKSIVPSSLASLRTYKRRKNERKPRPSSPIDSDPLDINFDELPISEKKLEAADKKSEKKVVAHRSRGKENTAPEAKAQPGKSKVPHKVTREKAGRVLEKQKKEDTPKKKLLPKIHARPKHNNEVTKRVPERVTRQSSKNGDAPVETANTVIEIDSPEKAKKEILPWDKLNLSSDNGIVYKEASGDLNGTMDSPSVRMVVDSPKYDVPDNNEFHELSPMDEDERLPSLLTNPGFGRLLEQTNIAVPKSKPKLKENKIQPIQLKQEPEEIIDLTMGDISFHSNHHEGEEYTLPSKNSPLPKVQKMLPGDPPVTRKVYENEKQAASHLVKLMAPEAPRKTVFKKLSMLQTPEAKVRTLKTDDYPHETLELHPFNHIASAVVNSPHAMRMPVQSDVLIKHTALKRDTTPTQAREYPFLRSEPHRSRREEAKEDPMTRIIEILSEINSAVINKIERRFDVITEGLTTGQRIILEGTAKALQEMHQESILYFNQMVDMEEQYTIRSSRIINATHNFIKSSEQLSQCLHTIRVAHSRQSLSKKLPTSLFPRIPTIIAKPGLTS